MLVRVSVALALLSAASANLFDFLQNQYEQQEEHKPSFEEVVLLSGCTKYVCPDTNTCVAGPKDCPCPFPSSQLRCPLPNGEYICISKPAGDFEGKYDDAAKNFLVDAKSDDVRDCGWVKRAWEGKY